MPYAGGQVATGTAVGILGNRSVFDTPFNTTGYTAQIIKDQQAKTVQDVLQNDPSVRTFYPSGSGDDRSVIRGFGVYDQDIGFNGIFGFGSEGSFPVEGLERVEILKGPAAFLNGITQYGSIGGAINLVPKRAGENPFAQATTSFSSRGQFGESIDVSNRYGDKKEFGIRFNGSIYDGDLPKDRSSSEIKSGVLGLDYRGERFRASFDGVVYDSQQHGTQLTGLYSLPGFQIPGAPSAHTNYQQPWEFIDFKNKFALAKGEYDIANNWTAFGAVGVAHSEWGSAYTFPQLTASNGNFTGYPSAYKLETDTFSAQAGIRGKFYTGEVGHSVVVALDGRDNVRYSKFGGDAAYASNIYDPVFIPKPTFGGFNFDNPPKTNEDIPLAATAADTLSFFQDRILLTVGLRQQAITTKAFDAVTGATTAFATQTATSPSVGLVVKPMQNVSVYANYIEGLVPTVATTGAVNGGQVFPPARAEQEEVGIKAEVGKVILTAALFQITQQFGIVDPATNVFSIGGTQRNRGLELQAQGEVTPGLRVIGGIQFLDPRLIATAGGVDVGNIAQGVPRIQGNANIEWDTPFLRGLTLTGRVISTGQTYVDTANLQSVPGWTRVDAGFRYAYTAFGKEQVVRFTMENVFDKGYWITTAFGAVMLANPRVYRLSHTITF